MKQQLNMCFPHAPPPTPQAGATWRPMSGTGPIWGCSASSLLSYFKGTWRTYMCFIFILFSAFAGQLKRVAPFLSLWHNQVGSSIEGLGVFMYYFICPHNRVNCATASALIELDRVGGSSQSSKLTVCVWCLFSLAPDSA